METNFFPFLVKAFSVYLNLFFNRSFILASRNHFFQYLKYPFYWKQFFHLLEIYFKRILYYSQWQHFLFSGNDILSFTLFRNHYCSKRETYVLKKSFISARGNRFLQFIQILIQIKVTFRSSEIAFFKESFILASGNRCSINFVHLFGAFFC